MRGRAFRFRPTILAVLGVCFFAPTAAAQTPFEMEMDVGGSGISVTATMPDPMKTAQKILECDGAPASCMEDVFEAATPVVKAKPSSPAPPAAQQPEPSSSPTPPPSPPQPEPTPGQQKDDSEASSNEATGSRARPARRGSTSEGVSSAGRPESAELGTSRPLVEERTGPPLPELSSPPPERSPEAAPLRGPDPLGKPTPTLSLPPALESGFDWSPLLIGILLAAGSLALLFFLLVAAPQHSLARVSSELADRRYDLGLIGAVMLFGVAVGYFVATWIG
jgi:hypothetical protein